MKSAASLVAAKYGLLLQEQPSASSLRIQKTDGLVFEVIIPHSVLEWFVTAKVSDEEVWSEWVDYYPTSGGSVESLAATMANDIDSFVSLLVARQTRIVEPQGASDKSQSASVEWLCNASWKRIAVAEA